MFKNDYILDMVETLGKSIGKIIKDENDDSERIMVESLSDKDMLLVILKKMLREGKYNEAENILFSFVTNYTDTDFSDIGKWFYKEISMKSDEELVMNNFSREEINQGIIDFEKITNSYIYK